MKLTKVTLTGADDFTDPKKLIEISKEYPFVEWGILFSLKHSISGDIRFPSWEWHNSLLMAIMAGDSKGYSKPNLSLHLCGDVVRTLVTKGRFTAPITSLIGFERIQLNFHAEKLSFSEEFEKNLIDTVKDGPQIIFQMDGENEHKFHELNTKSKESGIDIVPLFDKSHGTGISPNSWPKAIDGKYNGYAGGLGPDNLKEEIEKIGKVAGDNEVWIDMETKVRNNFGTNFDLDKCIKCLEIAKEYIKQG